MFFLKLPGLLKLGLPYTSLNQIYAPTSVCNMHSWRLLLIPLKSCNLHVRKLMNATCRVLYSLESCTVNVSFRSWQGITSCTVFGTLAADCEPSGGRKKNKTLQRNINKLDLSVCCVQCEILFLPLCIQSKWDTFQLISAFISNPHSWFYTWNDNR